ncbi:lipocalin family protein [Streptomyces sp. NPDC007162]|uniref:lipocalin family protein n=1 Tax=Streptomyces sp. NPDC007162 TaxID=3156917 RepID=UPI0033E79B09
MNLGMPGGDKIAVWDALSLSSGKQETCATVMHPDGSYELAAVTPFAQGARDFWKSPETGQVYPTRWKITIPSLKTSLTVTTSPKEQETAGPNMNRYEGTATFTGKYQGRHVTGVNLVETVGNWTP